VSSRKTVRHLVADKPETLRRARESVTDTWSDPVRININSLQTDAGPYLSGDGMTLYFNSDRAGGLGGNDLWVSTRERRRGNE